MDNIFLFRMEHAACIWRQNKIKKYETTHERHQQQQSPLGHDEKKVVEEG